MKKLIVFGLVIGGLAAMSSCKKSYTCECTPNAGGSTYEKEGKGSSAEEACNDAVNKTLTIPTEICVPK